MGIGQLITRSTRHLYKYNGGLNVKSSIKVRVRVSDRFSVYNICYHCHSSEIWVTV